VAFIDTGNGDVEHGGSFCDLLFEKFGSGHGVSTLPKQSKETGHNLGQVGGYYGI
jgi:hypothetical protein